MSENVYATQDPVYGIKDSRLIDMNTGEPIPHDEPIIILRASDKNSMEALNRYLIAVMTEENDDMVEAVEQRIVGIEAWQARNPDLMK